MSEWWSYRLSDFLLFSPRIYYRQFALYNAEIWPAQILALIAGLALLVLPRIDKPWTGRVVAAVLIVTWLWVAWAYLIERYAAINWVAPYFAVGFVIQTLLLAWIGLWRNALAFCTSGWRAWIGFGIALFAIAAQPLIAPLLAGREWMQVEIFGIAPDPTVAATLGILLAARRLSWPLLVLPLLWCAISGATAWTMQAPEAPLMPALALITVIAGWGRRRQHTANSAAA